jgi:hypothetical protein
MTTDPDRVAIVAMGVLALLYIAMKIGLIYVLIAAPEPPHWESATARLCAPCVEKAAFLMLTKPEVTHDP